MIHLILNAELPKQFVDRGMYFFSGFCIGQFGFVVLRRHKYTEQEIQEIHDFFSTDQVTQTSGARG